ncbi:hypothetical protein N7457_005719 [Penicillium paradoxum]|uniref:uncharacterized protein n=1 Tax=Penicillium paradoxum TaxID=176176 RepID=UPI002547B481|nr:uncharacterized protein N7457_005719 [Penicillium paradoxum]KAJ5780559.1 hypothetical protein N7457_005719 [Penicillium paradoxum]
MAPKYAFTLSDSESEAEVEMPSAPSDQALESGLRETVAAIFKSGNMEELTVKRVRLAAEVKLGLAEGYFKSTGVWKMRSEEIIKDEVVSVLSDGWSFTVGKILIEMVQGLQDQADQNPQSSPAQKSPSPPPKPKSAAIPKRSKPASAPKPRKRQKPEPPVVDEDDEPSVASGDESDEVTKPKKRSKAPVDKVPIKKTKGDISDASDIYSGDESEEVTKPKQRSKTPIKKATVKKTKEDVSDASDVSDKGSDEVKPTENTVEESESEMSVVLDEEPQPKAPRKRQKSAGAAAPKTKKASKAKAEDVTPDQAEIKRLQGWLIKCGIRKLWGKELAPYDTPKAKIKHLKRMLEDAGMTGRPSQEKANQIREERELKADLEQIQQGAKQWGANSDEDDDAGKPRRRLARGRQSLAFLESDGEETD